MTRHTITILPVFITTLLVLQFSTTCAFESSVRRYSRCTLRQMSKSPLSPIPLDRQRLLAHNLAVSLDRPLLEPVQTSVASNAVGGGNAVWRGIQRMETFLTSILFSQEFVLTFVSLVAIVLLQKVSWTKSINVTVQHWFKLLRGKFQRILLAMTGREQILSGTSVHHKNKGVPMVFGQSDGDSSSSTGWGVCTLTNKRLILSKNNSSSNYSGGSSSSTSNVEGPVEYVEYTFDLPRQDNTLPLELGQQISLCCLDNSQKMAKGDFYLASSRFQQGSFSIILPYNRTSEEMKDSIGITRSEFAHVLDDELVVGDEVAIKPGPKTLQYKGQYLPVTNMLYFVADDGVVPILDQVKSVLPNGSSSVKNVNVVWLNNRSEQFDVAYDELEKEFYKYNSKLEVSCCLMNDYEKIQDNSEVRESIPDFRPGVMAVVAGPSTFVAPALRYLRRRGYPKDVVCTLP